LTYEFQLSETIGSGSSFTGGTAAEDEQQQGYTQKKQVFFHGGKLGNLLHTT
jgi:hypothetical protein